MYTFHPQTNEGKNREVLERVLQEHTEDDILFLEDEENGVQFFPALCGCYHFKF